MAALGIIGLNQFIMREEPISSPGEHSSFAAFWDALAPYHAAIENSYLDLPSLRQIIHEIQGPVVVVGAGQGLIVAEIRKRGFPCDGVDLSPEMIRYAKLRRGIQLVQADARAMPFPDRTYQTVIYATGVVDFTDDEAGIRAMLTEGRRIAAGAGKVFVAFYRFSPAQENFLSKVGLLSNHVIALRESLGLYLLNPARMVTWVANRAGVSRLRALALVLRLSALTTRQERRMTFRMRTIVRKMANPESFISAAAEKHPYRDAPEIRRLFNRLEIPMKRLETCSSCFMVQLGSG